jgi:transglutaminase-like putative cysteine protease
MIYQIYHKTAYRYPHPVTFSHNIARLKPKKLSHQELINFELKVTPEVYETFEFNDFFTNTNHHLLIRNSHTYLSVEASSQVKIDVALLDEKYKNENYKSITLQELRNRLENFNANDIEAKMFLFESDLISYVSEEILEYANRSFKMERSLFECVHEFMQRVFNDFEFVSGFSDIATPIDEIFREKKGVCQDFAHLCIATLRTIGIPAKYVSGYIQTHPREGEEKLFGSDASHAWFSVYILDYGWFEFDPTNNLIPYDQHIILGYGRDYFDVAPLKGVVQSSGDSLLSVMVDVKRVDV